MRLVLGLAAVLLCTGAASADSARVNVRATVEPSCTFTPGQVRVLSRDPLIVTVPLTRNCNGPHTVTVTYDPDTLSNPDGFGMALGLITPTSKLPGVVTFNLPHTDSTITRVLRIIYDGPPGERLLLATTVNINVTMP
jgi:hypothetical protein